MLACLRLCAQQITVGAANTQRLAIERLQFGHDLFVGPATVHHDDDAQGFNVGDAATFDEGLRNAQFFGHFCGDIPTAVYQDFRSAQSGKSGEEYIESLLIVDDMTAYFDDPKSRFFCHADCLTEDNKGESASKK